MTIYRRLVALTAGVILLSGCGTATMTTAGSRAPSLVAALTTVDSSLAHREYAAARAALVKLISQTGVAQSNGSISKGTASRIVTAARELLRLLPKAVPAPGVVPSRTPTPSTSPSKAATKTATPRPAQPVHTPTATPTPTPSLPATPSPTPSPTATTSPAIAMSPSP